MGSTIVTYRRLVVPVCTPIYVLLVLRVQGPARGHLALPGVSVTALEVTARQMARQASYVFFSWLNVTLIEWKLDRYSLSLLVFVIGLPACESGSELYRSESHLVQTRRFRCTGT